MEIIKKLNLNKNPKDVSNGSIVCAKNMMVDDTGSFLTNDIGFKVAYDFDGENIVGIIPCSNEIIILTIEDTGNADGSHVYRKADNDVPKEVLCSWYYSGGKISGTYSYNYKGELIVTIGESDDNLDIPLKIFTIIENTDTQTKTKYPYTVSEPKPYYLENIIPRYDCSFTVTSKGSLVCGVYTFFIRFKISKDNYTKFFQLSGDINIVQSVTTKKYTHRYVDKRDYLKEEFGIALTVNNNAISTKGIELKIKFYESYYLEFQIAYIIKRNGDIQGRILGDYTTTTDKVINVVNNIYVSEISLESLLENPHQFFNVKNVINYNNRLYIANYKEYPVENSIKLQSSTAITTNSVTNVSETELNRIRARHAQRMQQLPDKLSFTSVITFNHYINKGPATYAYFSGVTGRKVAFDGYVVPTTVGGEIRLAMTEETQNLFWKLVTDNIFVNSLTDSKTRKYYSVPVYHYLDGKVYDSAEEKYIEDEAFYQTFLLTQSASGSDRTIHTVYRGGRAVTKSPIGWTSDTAAAGIDFTNILDFGQLYIKEEPYSANSFDAVIYALKDLGNDTWEEIPILAKDKNQSNVAQKFGIIVLRNSTNENAKILMSGWQQWYDRLDDATRGIAIYPNSGNLLHTIGIEFKGSYKQESLVVEEDDPEEPETPPIQPEDPDATEPDDPTVIVPHEEDTLTTIVQSSSTTTGVGPNARTLHPLQLYNLFVHYIRIDGSCTPGYPVGLVAYSVANPGTLIIPNFLVTKPKVGGYVGYFISYEDIERTVEQIVAVTEYDETTEKTRITGFTNAEYIYDLDTFRGERLRFKTVAEKVLAGSHFEYIEDRLNANRVRIRVSFYNNVGSMIDRRGYFRRIVYPIYSKKAKTLYRLTKNIYDWNNYIGGNEYLPDFFDKQNIIYFSNLEKRIVIIPSGQYVYKHDNNNNDGVKDEYYINYDILDMYSKFPTSAMNVKQDIEEVAVTLRCRLPENYAQAHYGDTVQGQVSLWDEVDYMEDAAQIKERGPFINSVMPPDKLHDYLELQSCYRAKPSKTYTNYREDNINVFDKTIYRSDIISDESLVNGFRHFEVNNYKNILENKGKITNLVGIGLYLLIHTEYSLFVFDRTPKLTQRAQTEIPDTFDVDYQEIMPSNQGFGGLLDKDESILTKHGYIWFDRANKIIFLYENGKTTIISGEIHNFLQYLGVINKVIFAEDIVHQRLFICINYKNTKYVTLSYNFNTHSYISVHDFRFTNNYRTYNKSYIIDTDRSDNRSLLYEFDETAIADYKDLTYRSLDLFPLIERVDGTRSYVDIICNIDYEISKVLESISYTLNEIIENIDTIIIPEQQLNRRFSGNVIRLYTDEVDTGNLDVETDNESTDIEIGEHSITYYKNVNKLNNYKYPYWDKGKWNLNYFRNRIDKRNEDDTNKTDENNTRPDNLSVVYGKYFVVRFIFDNDKKIKLDNIYFNINAY